MNKRRKRYLWTITKIITSSTFKVLQINSWWRWPVDYHPNLIYSAPLSSPKQSNLGSRLHFLKPESIPNRIYAQLLLNLRKPQKQWRRSITNLNWKKLKANWTFVSFTKLGPVDSAGFGRWSRKKQKLSMPWNKCPRLSIFSIT